MPSVIHGGEEFIDLPEAPSTTENEGTQAPYGISQHRTIVEEEGEKDGSVRACPQKSFSELRKILEHGMKTAITIDICSQSNN